MRRDYKGCRACVVGVPKDPNALPVLEWAHLGDKARAKTRNMVPEERHAMTWTICLCRYHHHVLDAHRMHIDLGPDGADGPARFTFTQHLGVVVTHTERGWTTPAVHA